MRDKLSSEKAIIDFVGVGAPKSGTTWVAYVLREHPEIDFAQTKDTFFFLSDKADVRKDTFTFRKSKNSQELLQEFRNDGTTKGEFSVFYMFDKESLENIKKHNPDMKIIVCLRDHASFLYSAYWYDKLSNAGHLFPETFEEFINSPKDVNQSTIRKNWTEYSKYLKLIFEIFPKKNVHIILFDDIKEQPAKVITSLFDFLDVDSSFKPSVLSDKVNPTMQMRNKYIQRFSFLVLELFQKLRLYGLLHFILHRHGKIKALVWKITKKDFEKPKILPETAKEIKIKYENDTQKVEKILDRKLPAWHA